MARKPRKITSKHTERVIVQLLRTTPMSQNLIAKKMLVNSSTVRRLQNKYRIRRPGLPVETAHKEDYEPPLTLRQTCEKCANTLITGELEHSEAAKVLREHGWQFTRVDGELSWLCDDCNRTD